MTLQRTFVELYVDDPASHATALATLLDLSVHQRLPAFFELANAHSVLLVSGLGELPAFLRDRGDDQVHQIGTRIELCFEMDDVDAAWNRVQASGYAVIEPIIDRPWGKRDFRVAGPNGSYLRITSSEEPQKRSMGMTMTEGES